MEPDQKKREPITVKRPLALKLVIGFFVAVAIVLVLSDTVYKAHHPVMPKDFETPAAPGS